MSGLVRLDIDRVTRFYQLRSGSRRRGACLLCTVYGTTWEQVCPITLYPAHERTVEGTSQPLIVITP